MTHVRNHFPTFAKKIVHACCLLGCKVILTKMFEFCQCSYFIPLFDKHQYFFNIGRMNFYLKRIVLIDYLTILKMIQYEVAVPVSQNEVIIIVMPYC